MVSSNRQIAKNTIYLYIRTAITMVIALFTSRVILKELGVSDYGVYNVIGGTVAMLTALSATLSGATQRFITYAIGKGDADYLKKIFTVSIRIHSLLAIILLIIAETVGLWFINYKMNIPAGRELAAKVVFHLSVISFIINILALPYNSAVIAYERFSFYALVDVFRSISRLVLIYCISYLPFDRLITYGCIELLIMIAYMIAYASYVRINFTDCTLSKEKSPSIYKEVLGFTGWSFLGTASSIVYTQGSNLLLNIFWGVLLNAAIGVTNQVFNAVNSFVSNFTIAVNPQITKSYASNNFYRTNELIFFGAKISSYLLLIIGFPIAVNIHYILDLWLVVVPDYTESFIRLALFYAFIGSFINPFNCLMFATGDIKVYQIICVIINISSVLLLYFAFMVHFHPSIIYYILIIQVLIKTMVMLFLSKKATDFPVRHFLFTVYFRSNLLLLIIPFTIFIKNRLSYQMNPFFLFVESSLFVLFIVLIIYSLGFNHKERIMIYSTIKKRIKKD